MKRKSIFCKLLAASFVMMTVLCCSKESQPLTLEPEVEESKPVLKTISYSVSANQVDPSTKVSVDADGKHFFQAGDKLVITGENGTNGETISGTLVIKDGFTSQSATFEGTLVYEGEDPSVSNPELRATLISGDNPIDYVDYTKAIASDLATAVHYYGNLSGTAYFNSRDFELDESSSFINFNLYAYSFQVGETVTVTISAGTTNIASNSITVTGTAGDEKAVFTAAFEGGLNLSSVTPIVTISGVTQAGTSNERSVTIKRPFKGVQLAAKKVYKVNDKAPQVGGIYYSDGTWTGNKQTEGAVPLGLIVYLNEGSNSKCPSRVTDVAAFADGVTERANGFGHGLVIAMKDCPITTNGVRWSISDNERIGENDPNTPFEQIWFNGNHYDEYTINSFNGIGKTLLLQNTTSSYPAAAAIMDYNNVAPVTAGFNMSSWFLPTITQWIASFMGIGGCTNYEPFLRTSKKTGIENYHYYPDDGDFYYDEEIYNNFIKYVGTGQGNDTFEMLTNICQEQGWSYQNIKDNKNYNWNYYWTSTQVSKQRALCIGFRDGYDVKGVVVAHHVKNRQDNGTPMKGRQVRAFLAF